MKGLAWLEGLAHRRRSWGRHPNSTGSEYTTSYYINGPRTSIPDVPVEGTRLGIHNAPVRDRGEARTQTVDRRVHAPAAPLPHLVE